MAVNDQSEATYTVINPSGSIPTLVIQEPQSEEGAKNKPRIIIWQSLAALEYLEERYPPSARQRGLLPPIPDQQDRATVRCLMNIISSDIHPLTTARVRRRIYEQFPSPATEAAAATSNREWDKFWSWRGLASYESVVQGKCGCGMYSVGDSIPLADVCLLPAVWTAEKYGMSLVEFPTIKRVFDALHCVEAVQRAHWRCQPATPEDDRVARPML